MNKALLILSVALVALAVIGGFFITGGPYQARMEKYDLTRWSDLTSVVNQMNCKNPRGDLPESLIIETMQAFCSGGTHISDDRFNDPETKAPYEYRVTSPTTFQICARFHDFESARNPHRNNRRNAQFGHVVDGDLVCFNGRVNTSE
ncbi:hypothetical protein ACXYMO_06445 [Arenibacterium sp. CAU 1754]